MEILDLRHFSSADLRPLLEDEISMWGRMLSWDYTTSAEMILRYMDAKILPGYAAIERGSIFGYSFRSEDEISMWGRMLSCDYTTSAEMILRYMDAKILPGYAAIERGSIFGYSF